MTTDAGPPTPAAPTPAGVPSTPPSTPPAITTPSASAPAPVAASPVPSPPFPDGFAHFARAVDFAEAVELYAREAVSELGRRRARGMAPLASADAIRARLAEADEVRRLIHRGERIPLAAIDDVHALADEACQRGRPLEPLGLGQVADACQAGIAVRKAFLGPEAEPDRFPALAALAERIPALAELDQAIRVAIEGERVRDTASARLQELRAEIERVKGELDRKIEGIVQAEAVRPSLASPKPSVRGGRYVLAVRAGFRPRPRGILHDRSQTGGTLYIEPTELVGLGNELNDLVFRERDEVTRILWELSREVFAERPALARLTDGLGALDLAAAKAKAAAIYGLAAPTIEADGPLVLADARHPLLLRQQLDGRLPGGEVVPLDLRLGEGFDLLVITGPNTGGKTVALKTAGLLAALALSGAPIPAGAGSRVPLYRRFAADIGDEQGIQQSLSTFSGHVAEVVRILASVGPGSLVLLDELGAGTDPEEGAALGAAVLEGLLARGAHAIVSTHLGALKAFAYSRPRVENASVAFSLETLRPTYQLAVGIPGASHALDIARRLGLPEEVVARAEEIRGQRGVGETALLDEVQRLRLEAERDRAEARELDLAAYRSLEEAEVELRRAATEREAVTREGDSALDGICQRLRRALADARQRAESCSLETRSAVQALHDELWGVLEHTPFAERRRAFAQSLTKGARVYVVRFGREGVVTRINKAKERVTVRVGGAEVDTSFDDLSWVEVEGRVRAPRVAGEASPTDAPALPDGAVLHADGRKRWV